VKDTPYPDVKICVKNMKKFMIILSCRDHHGQVIVEFCTQYLDLKAERRNEGTV
jgi:hypothetical protein